VAPKTQLLFQAVQTKYDYKPNSFAGWTTLDSTDRKYLVGVTWEAAAKTTGIFKVGQTKKDFSDASLRDFSKAGWEGQIKWSPLTYSSFDFSSSKTPGESTIGNASLDTRHGVSWNHAWNSRVSSVASYNYTDTDYSEQRRRFPVGQDQCIQPQTELSVDAHDQAWRRLRAHRQVLDQRDVGLQARHLEHLPERRDLTSAAV
jgi:hypothetical protein